MDRFMMAPHDTRDTETVSRVPCRDQRESVHIKLLMSSVS